MDTIDWSSDEGSGGSGNVDSDSDGGLSFFGFKIGVYTAAGLLLTVVVIIFILSSVVMV